MTAQDARERALEAAWEAFHREHYISGMPDGGDLHDAGEFMWDAAKREDEQRIAELVDGLDTVRNALWRYLGGRSARAAAINRAFDASMRALGQPEEVKP